MERVVIILFSVIIATPLFSTIAFPESAQVANEKRRLAQAPKNIFSKEGTRGFDSYWNDHIGLRRYLVPLHNNTKYKFFNQAPTDDVYAGKDGYLFLRSHFAEESLKREIPMKGKRLKAWIDFIQKAQTASRECGAEFLFVMIPNKHTIYPENLPPLLGNIDSLSSREILGRRLAKESILFLDLTESLLAEKEKKPVFRKLDTHWNHAGAWLGHLKIIRKLGLSEENIPDIKPVQHQMSGDLSHMIALNLKESVNGLKVQGSKVARAQPPSGDSSKAKSNKRMILENRTSSSLPTALIYRDSFFSELVPFMGEHFSRMEILWKYSVERAELERAKPDIVIMVIIERYLDAPVPSFVP